MGEVEVVVARWHDQKHKRETFLHDWVKLRRENQGSDQRTRHAFSLTSLV
jgi:hypothetical protein